MRTEECQANRNPDPDFDPNPNPTPNTCLIRTEGCQEFLSVRAEITVPAQRVIALQAVRN